MRKLVLFSVLIGLAIGFLGSFPKIEAQGSRCMEGSYITISRSGLQIMVGTLGKTLPIVVPNGTTNTFRYSQIWHSGYKIHQGVIDTNTGLMTVNRTITRSVNSTPVAIGTSSGNAFLFELDCDFDLTAIESVTTGSLGQVTGIQLDWISGCTIPAEIRMSGSLIGSLLLTPYNQNRVSGILGVVPETYTGMVSVTIPGSSAQPSLPFSAYSGKWETSYYITVNTTVAQLDFGFTQFQNLGPIMSQASEVQMASTSFWEVSGSDNAYVASSFSPAVYSVQMALATEEEEATNAFNIAFNCPSN